MIRRFKFIVVNLFEINSTLNRTKIFKKERKIQKIQRDFKILLVKKKKKKTDFKNSKDSRSSLNIL